MADQVTAAAAPQVAPVVRSGFSKRSCCAGFIGAILLLCLCTVLSPIGCTAQVLGGILGQSPASQSASAPQPTLISAEMVSATPAARPQAPTVTPMPVTGSCKALKGAKPKEGAKVYHLLANGTVEQMSYPTYIFQGTEKVQETGTGNYCQTDVVTPLMGTFLVAVAEVVAPTPTPTTAPTKAPTAAPTIKK